MKYLDAMKCLDISRQCKGDLSHVGTGHGLFTLPKKAMNSEASCLAATNLEEKSSPQPGI